MHFSKTELEVFDASTRMEVGYSETALLDGPMAGWESHQGDSARPFCANPEAGAEAPHGEGGTHTAPMDYGHPGGVESASPLAVRSAVGQGAGL